MLPALLALAALFLSLFVGRVGLARRKELLRRWPALVLALAAFALALRGQIWGAVVCAGLAGAVWYFWPVLEQRRRKPAEAAADDPEDSAARALLGVSRTATAAEIRSAYRAKIAHAHPDRGGKHAEAARLTAARDRLLRKVR